MDLFLFLAPVVVGRETRGALLARFVAGRLGRGGSLASNPTKSLQSFFSAFSSVARRNPTRTSLASASLLMMSNSLNPGNLVLDEVRNR